MNRTSRISLPHGFTLVEIMIVLVILAILASVTIPKFSNAAESARSTATLALLKTLRIQLEVYKAHHRDDYPTLAELWTNLIEKTDAEGNLDPAGRYGGYLTKPPVHQYTRSTTVVAPGTGTATDGWEYDETTGAIAAVGFDEETGIFITP